jgi:hypothetical protein
VFAKYVLPALASALLVGCSEQSRGPRVRSGDPDVEVKSPTGLSEEELRKLAEQIVAAAQKQDVPALGAIFDWDAVIYAAASDIQAPIAEHRRFAAEMKGDGKRFGVLAGQIFGPVARGASYRFLRSNVVGDEQRLLFRLSVPEPLEFNYHDVILSRRPDGKIRASDVYNMMNGELLSQTTRRAFLMTTLHLAEASAAKFSGIEQEFQQHFKKIQMMNELVAAQKFKEVQPLYDLLPLRLQRDKNVLLTRLIAAQAVGGDPYKAAIDDFRMYFPDDPCIERFSVSYYVGQRDFATALSKVDVIEKAVGGDPYLNVVRSNLQLEAGNAAAALAFAEKAVAAEPTLIDTHVALLYVSLYERKHSETLDRLNEIVRRFGTDPGDLTKLPRYAEFVKSPEYQAWLKLHSSH